MNLLNLTHTQLVEHFRREYNRGQFHATALYRAFYRSADWRLSDLPEFSNTCWLQHKIRQDMEIFRPAIVAETSDEGVTKLVFQLKDGHTVETVIIPMANHFTICISCQVGCAMACRFCQTGRLGFTRNLDVDEIVAQVYTAKVEMGINIRNVVFMGMGEPLDNFNVVTQAILVMEDQRGLNIAKRHITVSTVGLPHKIQQLADLNWPQLKLAISLNASNDMVRTKLMPINQTYSMGALKKALNTYPLARNNVLFIEYVLVRGVNDHPKYTRQLVDYFGDWPVKLNLIPFNPGPQSTFAPPSTEDIHKFHQSLIDQNIFVRLRSTKGAAIRAACGQLGKK